MTVSRPVHLVPHTHWDREWYLPFEGFRSKLLTTLDLLLDALASDPGWTHFHLDGQTAMIDDYLEKRPERAPDITAYIRAGRLSCGPWVTLVDEFLVSGESIIRNLEAGLARAEQLGGAERLGYLPDQFGHIGQMPQVLKMFGIDTAITWRGVPSDVGETVFSWRSREGSEVTATYLPFGYGQGKRLPPDPDALLHRLEHEEAMMAEFLAEGQAMLLTAGDDHEPPEPTLPRNVAILHERGIDVQIVSLADHISTQPLPRSIVVGELRSAARANLLPNTYSVRPQQKLERARAEHLLERYAEPLASLVPTFDWPQTKLDEAWTLLHLNGAHDSVCGCSTDEVASAVDQRTRAVINIATEVRDRALTTLAKQIAAPGTLQFNPSPFGRDGVPGVGWAVTDTGPPLPEPLEIVVSGGVFSVGDATFAVEDQSDIGDLYNFAPEGEPSVVMDLQEAAGAVVAKGRGFTALITAEGRSDERFFSLDIEITNEAPDHRVRLLQYLPEPVNSTRAGAPFEVVERPPLGEGGPGEIASPWWPARGFVMAGTCGWFAEEVFEYELMTDALAVTLMRCTGTISRPHPISTRKGPAGPDVATPLAQLIGTTTRRFGVPTSDPGDELGDLWERFALPIVSVPAPGGGRLPDIGRLIEIVAPALSSIRRKGDELEIRVHNPGPLPSRASIANTGFPLRPFEIATKHLDRSAGRAHNGG